jgi:hypothetical protein
MAEPLTIKQSGDKNGNPVLDFSDELYRRVKEALLGTGLPFISDERDTQDFVGRQKNSALKNPRAKVGHWMQTIKPVEFSPMESVDYPVIQTAYYTTLKFVPPVDPTALKTCLTRFAAEFNLQEQHVPFFQDSETRTYLIKQGKLNEATQMHSRAAFSVSPGGGDEMVKIQIPEPEFEKIRDKIVISDPASFQNRAQ